MGSAVDRERQQWEGAEYFLPCDTEESQRLTLQHDFVMQVMNGSLLFLPDSAITALSQSSAHVLDVGTGNGIWPGAFYKNISSLPSLTGIDITTKMFPTQNPSNMTFKNESVMSLPLDWSGSFDLVHQRFLIAALTVQQWLVALGEDFRVTKPGGWLHIVEVDPRGIAVGPHSTRLLAAMKQLFKTKDMDMGVVDSLPSMVSQVGWVDVQVHDREWPIYGSDEKGVAGRNAALRGHKSVKGAMSKLGLMESDEFDTMMLGVEAEWETIKGEPHIVRIVTARKPES